MAVLCERTEQAVSEIDYALTILESYPNDILLKDRDKLPDLYHRFSKLVFRDWGKNDRKPC